MNAEGQEHGASRVLEPVFTPAGGNDASVREEIQGPGQDFEGPRHAFQGAERVRHGLLSGEKSMGLCTLLELVILRPH